MDTTSAITARRRQASPKLKLTSMIDVVFLLLIYFVVTTSFAQQEGVVIARLPGERARDSVKPPEPEPQALKVRVSSAGMHGYRLQVADAGLATPNFVALQQVLIQLQHSPQRGRRGMFRPDRDRVEIQPDGQVRWAHVVNAYNAAVAAEYQRVGLRFAE